MATPIEDAPRSSGNGDPRCSSVANPIVVHVPTEDEGTRHHDRSHTELETLTTRYNDETPDGQEAEAPRTTLHGISEMTKELMHNAVVKSTHRKYRCIEQKWLAYCQKNDMDPNKQGTVGFLNFLSHCYENKAKWGYLRSFIPALAKYTKDVNMPLVKQLMRGVFKLRPPVAR